MRFFIQNIQFKLLKLFIYISFSIVFILYLHSQTDTVFWFAVPDLSSLPGGAYDRPTYFRFSTFANSSTITLSMPANSSFTPIVINMAANSHQSINMQAYTDQIESYPSNTIINKGLKIRSSNPIICYYEVAGQDQANPDIFTLKGKNALGLKFHIPFQNYYQNCSSSNGCANSSFDIIASENNTTVTITPKNNITGHTANTPFTITLNKGQVYSAMATSRLAINHLGGSIVVADKPVAITITDDLTNNIPTTNCQDLIGDQMIPKEVLGTEYILVRGELSIKDKFFICASEPNTSVSKDGAFIGTIQPGQLLADSFATETTYINSNSSICVFIRA